MGKSRKAEGIPWTPMDDHLKQSKRCCKSKHLMVAEMAVKCSEKEAGVRIILSNSLPRKNRGLGD